MQGSGDPLCLATGEGTLPCDAEEQAIECLLRKLCDSFYVIQANPQYYRKKILPSFALNPDPSLSHVYKVVFLKNNSRGRLMPKPVCGAVDYVENYDELTKYIETHGQSGTKADLFILNVLKADRPLIREVCQANGLQLQFMIGCSDMGIYAFRNLSTLLILQDLLKDGGKNIKYKLIGPRDKYGENDDKFHQNQDEKISADLDQTESKTCEKKELVISQWLANNLVVMEVVSEWNELESTKEIIWRSVRDCPDTAEFIIEKKRSNLGMVLAEALIDRMVVGTARGFEINQVKIATAENAMHNLKKYCNYIEAKKSYFGSSLELPYFLRRPNPIPETKIYRIADKNRGPPNKILQQFAPTCLEDLYFLGDYTETERDQIAILAKKKNFLVRWIGKEKYLCVYKKRKPNEVLKELLFTHSKENEKYKLHTPPKIPQQTERIATNQNWNNQGKPQYEQDNIQSLNRGQEQRLNPPPVRDTQTNSAGHGPPYAGHGRASQSCMQRTEVPGQGNSETPSWVMKFIESAPKKPYKPLKYKKWRHETEPPRKRDDVYSRYRFVPPKPPPAATSNMDLQTADQRPNQNGERDQVKTDKDLECGITLSERLQRRLEEQNLSNRPDLNVSEKRPFEQGYCAEVECEPSEKIFKSSTIPHRSQFTSSFGSQSFKGEGKMSNNYSESQRSELSTQTPRIWNSSVGNSGFENPSWTGRSYDESFSANRSFEEGNGETNSFHMKTDTQPDNFQYRNSHEEGAKVKVENEFGKDNNKLFDMRPEYNRYNNSQWKEDTKQQFNQRPTTSTGGQRNFTNLFDYSGSQDDAPQGFSRPLPVCPPRPPPVWKNKQFRGHKFGKLEKYGKKKGPYTHY